VLPAWSAAEKSFALAHGAEQLVLTMQHGALKAGFSAAVAEADALARSWPART
jgi:4-hydroxy-2-oxoheptanedioate aldolase